MTWTSSHGTRSSGLGRLVSPALGIAFVLLLVALASAALGAPSGASPPAASPSPLASSLTVTGASPAAASLAWPASSNLLFSSYGVLVSSNNGSSWTQVANVTSVSATTFFRSGLTPGATYQWKIREYDLLTYNDSNTVTYTQPKAASLSGSVVSASSVSLSWTNDASYGGNVSFASSTLFESVNGGGSSSVANFTSSSTTSDALAGLSAGTTYTFRLETTDACNGAANCGSPAPTSSTWSNSVNLTTPSASPTNYSVTFTESGLASGTSWSVTVGGATKSATSAAIAFSEANGTYAFSVGTVSGYTANPSSGSVTVRGAAASASVAFSPVSATQYSVTFDESGLASGTSWSVSLSGTSKTSTGSSLSFSEPNGTYAYSVGAVSGYLASPTSGSTTVHGAAVVQTITFTVPPPGTYTVTFTENGLPSATNWSVTLGGAGRTSTGTTIVFSETNGSYTFTVAVPSGYAASPASGSLTVAGGSASQSVAFTSLTGGGSGGGGSGGGGNGSNGSGTGTGTGGGNGTNPNGTGGVPPKLTPPARGSLGADLVDALPAIILLLVILAVAVRARAGRQSRTSLGPPPPPGAPPQDRPSLPASRPSPDPPTPVASASAGPRPIWDEDAEPVRPRAVHLRYVRDDEKLVD